MHGPLIVKSSLHFAPLPICVKLFHSQCYLVATVIHIQSLHSQIGVCINIFFRGAGWAKEIKKKKIGREVKGACQGNLSACKFGDACHRFVSPVLEPSGHV